MFNAYRNWRQLKLGAVIFIVLAGVIACQQAPTATPQAPTIVEQEPAESAPAATAVPESTRVAFPQSADEIQFLTIAIDAPSRNLDFADIDDFGRVIGFDPDIMTAIANQAGIEIEFVVTGFEGILQSVAIGEFDAAMSSIVIPDTSPSQISFTDPYLEVGQLLVVRANERSINSMAEFPAEGQIGIQINSSAATTAVNDLAIDPDRLRRYDSSPRALQALIDQDVDGVILDSDDAIKYVDSYYQQLKIAGAENDSAWISRRGYGIAVAAENQALLDLLNQMIATIHEDGTVQALTETWLVPQETLVAGESLIGTLDKEFVLGMVTADFSLDPASGLDPISWELQTNTMSGLMGFTADNQLVPILAADFPSVSTDGLEYTFTLREGLTFPDGRALTAEDVVWSLTRSARVGNFLVNSFLKDANIDGFADEDAVQAVNASTVRIVLDEPTSYFLAVLASPPYFIVSQDCFTLEINPASSCGGIGPYSITNYESGEFIRLKANAQWPGITPSFENIQVRFYADSVRMRRSLENQAIDVAWLGLPYNDLVGLGTDSAYSIWEGSATFKSYLVFEHNTAPWTNPIVREAASYALDRNALSDVFGGARRPLFTPIPDDIPGHLNTQPDRDLEQAIRLLNQAGYSENNPVSITIDYVNDGRYSASEAEYAELIKSQLEETNIFVVTLQGDSYDGFRQRSATCQSSAFVLGWPPSGQPPYYIDPSHWINYFLFNTDSICSNYESAEMAAAVATLERLSPLDSDARNQAYGQIQEIWAEEFPTLDLTQELRFALSLSKVNAVEIDGLGLMRYEYLAKDSDG